MLRFAVCYSKIRSVPRPFNFLVSNLRSLKLQQSSFALHTAILGSIHLSPGQMDSQFEASQQLKSTQVCETRTCVRTCHGWPDGFTSRLTSSNKSQKVVNFTHIQLTCDQLASTYVGWPNGEKLVSTCVRI